MREITLFNSLRSLQSEQLQRAVAHQSTTRPSDPSTRAPTPVSPATANLPVPAEAAWREEYFHILSEQSFVAENPQALIQKIVFSRHTGLEITAQPGYEEQLLQALQPHRFYSVVWQDVYIGSKSLQDKKFAAYVFLKIIAIHPDFEPYAQAFSQLQGIDLKNAYSDTTLPTWIGENAFTRHEIAQPSLYGQSLFNHSVSSKVYDCTRASINLQFIALSYNHSAQSVDLSLVTRTNELSAFTPVLNLFSRESDAIYHATRLTCSVSRRQTAKIFEALGQLSHIYPQISIIVPDIVRCLNRVLPLMYQILPELAQESNRETILRVLRAFNATAAIARIDARIAQQREQETFRRRQYGFLFSTHALDLAIQNSLTEYRRPCPSITYPDSSKNAETLNDGLSPEALEAFEKAHPDWICPLSQEIMSDPVYDRHNPNETRMERAYLERSLVTTQGKHPFTKRVMGREDIVSDETMKKEIDEAVSEVCAQKSTAGKPRN